MKLTDQHIEAAQLLAEGEMTDVAIAERFGITRQTLWNWRQKPEFAALIDEQLSGFKAEVRRRGLASVDHRVKALNDRWVRMRRVIEERAEHPDYADAPGGTTGLLVKTYKQLGGGEHARTVEEFAVDTGLLRELREHEKQAAQELGQWSEKSEITGADGASIAFTATVCGMSSEEIRAWREKKRAEVSGRPMGPPG